ncbi:MAG: DUF151 domain-containing protein [Actinomycetota bacterium]|nr:DUF151 domain-containing protein [Actinomycetota bacterium]
MPLGDDRRWKVGELATATGLTVRALHHYDEVGLLVPEERNQARHRLYGEDEVRRLYRILALRRLGLPLGEIGSLLDDDRIGLVDTVRRHLDRVERDLDAGQRLRRALTQILDALDRSAEPSIDRFIDALEVMSVIEARLEDVIVPVAPGGASGGSGPASFHGQPVILLKEQEGERVLPIWIGHPEAGALAVQLTGKVLTRPMTPDLTAGLIDAVGARVERVSVSRYDEDRFYATVTVTGGGASHEVDARPSDALNLAVRTGARIFVEAHVMEDWSVPDRAGVPAQLNQCGGPHKDAAGYVGAPSAWRSLLESLDMPSPRPR